MDQINHKHWFDNFYIKIKNKNKNHLFYLFTNKSRLTFRLV